MKKNTQREVPEVFEDSAMVLAVILKELGFGGKTNEILVRGDEFLDATMTQNTTDVLGDDLDAYSVAVGFAAALGAFASCLSAADSAVETPSKTKIKGLLRQMRKAGDN